MILLGLILAVAVAAGILWVVLRVWTKKSDITLGVDRSVTVKSQDEIAKAKERYTASSYAGIKVSDKNKSDIRVAIVFDRLSETPVNEKVLKHLEDHKAKATFSVPGVEAAENDEFLAALPVTGIDIAGNTLEDNVQNTSEGNGRLIEKLVMTKNVLSSLADKEVKGVFLSGTGYSGSVLKAVKACGFDYVIEPENEDLIDYNTFKDRESVKKYVSKLSGNTIIMIELNGLADAIKEEVPVYPDVPAIDKQPDAEAEETEEEEEPVEIDTVLEWLLCELEERDIKTELVDDFETKRFEETRLAEDGEAIDKAPVYTRLLTDKGVAGLAFYGLPVANADEVISTLKASKSKATFFVTAKEAEENREVLDKIRQAGFFVATAGKTGDDMQRKDVRTCYEEIKQGLEGVADLESVASSCYMPNLESVKKEDVSPEDLFTERMDNLRKACTANGVRLIYPVEVTDPAKGDISTIKAENEVVDINQLNTFIEAAKNNRLKVISVDELLEGGGRVAAYTSDDIRKLRTENAGKTEDVISFVPTVQPAVALEFYGLPSTSSIEEILTGLKNRNAKATFYVTYDDMTSRPEQIEKIVLAGQELGIAYRETKSYPQKFEVILRYLNSCTQYMEWRFCAKPALVMMPTGKPERETKEAVSAAGLRFAGFTFNFASGKLTDLAFEDVSKQASVYDKIRVYLGSALLFRPDYYESLKSLAALSENAVSGNSVSENELPEEEILEASEAAEEEENDTTEKTGEASAFIEEILKTQVDTIAYCPKDTDEPEKASEYDLVNMSSLLGSKDIYELPENRQEDIEVSGRVLKVMETDEERCDYMAERYLGNPSVLTTGEFPGFTAQEVKKFDKKGIVTDDKKLFLTFDDWGTDRSLNKLLYVLKKHNVKATFFVITKNVKDNPNLLRRIAMDGHEIATHTHSHYSFADQTQGSTKYLDLTPSENRALRSDIVISYDTLIKYAGDIEIDGRKAVSKNLRPPTLAVSKSGLTTMFDVGFSNCVLGNFSTHDYEAKSADELINKLKKGITSWNTHVTATNGAVIIMHMTENAAYSAQALDVMIPEWKEQGYEFARIDDYLN